MKRKMRVKRKVGLPKGSKDSLKRSRRESPQEFLAKMKSEPAAVPAAERCSDCDGSGYVKTTPGNDAALSVSRCPRCTGTGRREKPLVTEPEPEARTVAATPLACDLIGAKALEVEMAVCGMAGKGAGQRELAIARTSFQTGRLFLAEARRKIAAEK